MKVTQILAEHKKGVKAVKYSKKPQPLVGPEALKKKAKIKAAAPKSELEKHSKLKTTLEYREKNNMKISDLVEANYSYAVDDEGISPEEQLRRAKLLGFQTPRTVSYKDTDGVEASFQHTVHGSLLDPNWQTEPGKDYDYWVEKGMVAFRDPERLKKIVAFHQTQLNTQLQQGNEREAKNHAYKIGSMSAHLQDAEQYQRVKDKVAQLDQGANGSATGKKTAPGSNKIQDLQNAILARDPKALPRYGADGKMGKETRAAMAKYPDIAKQFPGIKEGYPKQQISRYNPDGDTYKQQPMPTLDKDPVDDAEPLDVLKNEPYEVDFDKANLKKDVDRHLDMLSKKAQFVLRAKFMHNMTNQEIADRMDISQERVRQIEGKALRHLRTGSRADVLATYFKNMQEGKIKVKIKHPPESVQEKLYKKHQEIRKKSGLPDPEEYKKKAAEKRKEIDDMKEAKQPETPKLRNFVAKNAKTSGAGKHKDAKKSMKDVRGQKHKNKEMAESGLQYSIGVDKHGKDYMTKAAKLMRAGGSQEQLGRLRDKESKAYKNKKESVAEAMGKVVDYKPGVSATIDTGPGMTTQLDLKKNPTSLTKDPSTGKLKLMPGTAATAQPSATTQSTVKPGDQVEMPKTNTMAEDILRLAGLR
jgi:RNA polymerase sigma factor (sigma-70 family)